MYFTLTGSSFEHPVIPPKQMLIKIRFKAVFNFLLFRYKYIPISINIPDKINKTPPISGIE